MEHRNNLRPHRITMGRWGKKRKMTDGATWR
jgi:hypothetical protein